MHSYSSDVAETRASASCSPATRSVTGSCARHGSRSRSPATGPDGSSNGPEWDAGEAN